MTDPKIPACIVDQDRDVHYNVKLHSIPAKGDLIQLWSMVDQRSGHDCVHCYRVVDVAHYCYDIDTSGEVREELNKPCHIPSVFVESYKSDLFEKQVGP